MTTTQYLRAFARFWWLIVALAAAGVAAAFLFGASTATRYTASAEVAMATTRRVPKEPSNLASANALAIQRMATYVAAAQGTGLVEKIPDDERSGLSATALARRLDVSSTSGSTVFRVSATGSSEASAGELADIGAAAMVRVVAGVEDATTPGKPLLRARLLRSAEDQPVEVAEGSAWQAPLLCGAAGLLLGLALAVAISRAAPRLRDRRSASDLVGAPVLDVVPTSGKKQRSSSYFEAIDNVRSGLFFMRQGDACLTVSLTPSQRVEPLALLVDDLASSLVATGARVLVVDADLAGQGDPSTSGSGLAELLSGSAPLKGLVHRASDGHHVITAGTPQGSPSDLLHHSALGTLLDGARSRYDYVLVITSPATEATGATAVAARCAAPVLVVPERTRSVRVRRAVDTLAAVGATVRGAILLR